MLSIFDNILNVWATRTFAGQPKQYKVDGIFSLTLKHIGGKCNYLFPCDRGSFHDWPSTILINPFFLLTVLWKWRYKSNRSSIFQSGASLSLEYLLFSHRLCKKHPHIQCSGAWVVFLALAGVRFVCPDNLTQRPYHMFLSELRLLL